MHTLAAKKKKITFDTSGSSKLKQKLFKYRRLPRNFKKSKQEFYINTVPRASLLNQHFTF